MRKGKGRAALTACCLAGAMVLAVPARGLADTGGGYGPGAEAASEKPEDMDDETWNRLQDDVLEYQEIPALVEHFSPVYRQVLDNIALNAQPYADAAARLRESALELRNDARAARDDGDQMGDQVASMTADIQTETAKTFEKVVKSIDGASRTTKNSTRKQLIQGVQQLMTGYCQARGSKELTDTSVELAQAAYDTALVQRQTGMATDGDVQTAQKNLLTAQKQQKALDDSMTTMRQNLAYLTGRSYDAPLEIGALPSPDVSRIDAMNPEADFSTALSYNYTYIGQRSTSGKGTANHDVKFRTMEETEEKLKIRLDALYQAVLQSRAAYEAAGSAYESAAIEMNANEQRYAMGMLSRLGYLQARAAFLQQKAAYETAAAGLQQAMDTYDWALQGIVDLDA